MAIAFQPQICDVTSPYVYGTRHGGWPQSRPHCARWRPKSPSAKRGHSPTIFAHFYCGQTTVCIRILLRSEVGLSPGDTVLDGDPDSSPKAAQPPLQFSVHVRCGQTAGWTKMPLGMEVGLGPGNIVLDGDPCSSPKERGYSSPTHILAHVCCGQTAGWTRMRLGTKA